jgi:hypothetical protein
MLDAEPRFGIIGYFSCLSRRLRAEGWKKSD